MATYTINGKEIQADAVENCSKSARGTTSRTLICAIMRGCTLSEHLQALRVGRGASDLVAFSETPIIDGMKVQTHTPSAGCRRTNLILMLANHDLNCTICKKKPRQQADRPKL
jgi:predicted molibdopterin-dependent oxidoreductase YjgC